MNLSDTRLIICPRRRGGYNTNLYEYTYEGHSHTGLYVSAQNTAKVLRVNGIDAQVRAVLTAADIQAVIDKYEPTHVAINALWLPEEDTKMLVMENPYVDFTCIVHSNIAFLQSEPSGIKLLRKLIDLEMISLGSFRVSGNSANFVKALQESWEAPANYLPNMYYLDPHIVRASRPMYTGGPLRIGAFGAQRPLKNPTVSAMAALAIATNLNTNLEFFINTGRTDGWGQKMYQSVRAIMVGLPYAKLVEVPWTDWANFRRHVSHMHLLLQPSFTETFNIVTADGIAEGIASVTSHAIEWVPEHWKGSPEDVQDIERVGRALLSDRHAGRDGLAALTAHNVGGLAVWMKYLQSKII